MTSSPKNARKSIIGRLIFSVTVLAVAAGVLLYRQPIIDQISLWGYRPSQEVSAITHRVEMTDIGKHYFYVSRPEIQDRTTFGQSCTTMKSETSVVLGCYVAQRIFLFNVTDPKLNGIKEVTAAHEMLHVAYDRLPANERGRIGDLLESEAAKITDPEFTSLMKTYEQTEPGERLNELHSIIGTQIAAVSPELEAYYARYFVDRARLVGLYSGYQAVFTEVQQQQTRLVEELDGLVNQINHATNEYNEGVIKLDDNIKDFNQRTQINSFESQEQFNSERAALLARQKLLANNRTLIDGYIATYNTKKQQLAVINDQAEELNHSINSSLTPLPSI